MQRTRKVRRRSVSARVPTETPADPRLHNWEGARAFLEIARRGSFRTAARSLSLSVNTLRRHIEEFENEIGFVLFTRHVNGVRLTPEGKQLIGAAERMEAASFDVARQRNLGKAMEGEVRIGITEGLGTFWLAPRLVEFQRAHPEILVDLHCEMSPADVFRLEADIGIQITRPAVKDLRIVKLGRMHAMLFASPEYLDAYGYPKSLTEIFKHPIVLQTFSQIASVEKYMRDYPDRPKFDKVAFRINVSSAHYWVIANGGGIGILPTYATALGGNVVPIDVEETRFSHDIWLAYHPDVAKIPRVSLMIDWLIEAFSPKKYPWFRNEFIHPRDFPKAVDGLSLHSLFAGFENPR